jgi:hypothetical protein
MSAAFIRVQLAQGAALKEVLGRAERLRRWMDQPIEPELRAQLAESRRRLADELLDVLTTWVELGGSISLGDAVLGEEPTLPSLPRGAAIPDLASPPPATAPDSSAATTIVPRAAPVRTPVAPRAAAPAPAVVAPPPAASGDALRGLRRHFEAGGHVKNEGISTNWSELLDQVVAQLGAPREDGEGELTVLAAAIRDADRWRGLPRELQRNLVGLVTSRLRRAQDEMGVSGVKLDEAFSGLSAWSKREQPGWVNGLSRSHLPTRGSWTADAEAYAARLPRAETAPAARESVERLLEGLRTFLPEFNTAPAGAAEAVAAQFRQMVRKAVDSGVRPSDPRLLKLVGGHAELFEGTEFKALRKALREDAEPAEGEDDDRAPPLPPDWPWWGRTRFRRGVLVGGDPREPNRERLERAFGFAELEWVGTEFKRNNLQTVRDRVRAGKLDIVILLGAFVGHDADDVILPVARECGVDWVHVDKGYGIVRVRRAIERFLDPLASR